MKNLKTLADQINDFDLYYTQGSNATFTRLQPICNSIRRELAALTSDEMIALRDLISIEDKHLHFCFYEFKGLAAKATTAKRSRVMTNAWFYFRKGIYTTFSECLKAAWKAAKVTSKLRKGIISITYRKATGELRKATGTLNGNLYTFNRKGVRTESKADTIRYFDLEKQAWRMFRIERLISA